MAHIAEAKIVLGRSRDESMDHVRASIHDFEVAHQEIATSLALVAANATYVREHWDEAFDSQLRQTGCRGSLFILRDFKMHLDGIHQSLGPMIEVQRTTLAQMQGGVVGEPFDPLLGSTTRMLCRALIRFLEYEDQMAQTQLALFSLAAREATRKG